MPDYQIGDRVRHTNVEDGAQAYEAVILEVFEGYSYYCCDYCGGDYEPDRYRIRYDDGREEDEVAEYYLERVE